MSKYFTFEIDGVSRAENKDILEAFNGVNQYRCSAGIEWLPGDQITKVTLGADDPAHLTACLDNVRTAITTAIGKAPDIDLEVLKYMAKCRTGGDCQGGFREYIQPADTLLFNMASGNLTSRRGVEYVANGTILYEQTGPREQLKSIEFNSADANFLCAAPPAWMQPREKDFAVEFWLKQKTTNPNPNQMLFDLSFAEGTQAGMACWLNQNAARFGIHDGVNLHVSEFNHGGVRWQDNTWHRFGWIVQRSRSKAIFFYNDDVKTTQKLTGVDLDQIGDVVPTGGAKIGGRENDTGNDPWVFGGCIAAIRFSRVV